MRFKAKPTKRIIEQMALEEAEYVFDYEWLQDKLDDEGFVTGFFVSDNNKDSEIGYIVGGMIEANEDYCSLEYWVPVIKDTVVLVEE